MAGEATLFDELIDELEQSAEVAEDAQDAEEAEVAEEAEEALQDDDDQEQPWNRASLARQFVSARQRVLAMEDLRRGSARGRRPRRSPE